MTTSIGADRQSDVAVQKYPDALFMRTEGRLYFGDGGNVAMWFDNTDSDLCLAGHDVRFSDTQMLVFGDGADATITFDGALLALGGTWALAGADIQLSDTQELRFGDGSDVVMYGSDDHFVIDGLSDGDPGVVGALWISDGHLMSSTA